MSCSLRVPVHPLYWPWQSGNGDQACGFTWRNRNDKTKTGNKKISRYFEQGIVGNKGPDTEFHHHNARYKNRVKGDTETYTTCFGLCTNKREVFNYEGDLGRSLLDEWNVTNKGLQFLTDEEIRIEDKEIERIRAEEEARLAALAAQEAETDEDVSLLRAFIPGMKSKKKAPSTPSKKKKETEFGDSGEATFENPITNGAL